MEGNWQGMQSKEGSLILFISLSRPPPADSRRSVCWGRTGRAMKLGRILHFPSTCRLLAPSSMVGVVSGGGGGRCWGWALQAAGAQQNSWRLRRAVGGGEWGLALVRKLISFGCCSRTTGAAC